MSEGHRDNHPEDSHSLKTRSQTVSRHSSRSSASAALRARAKAEAARLEVSYAEKEASVMKEKARLAADMACKEANLEAQLHVLKLQRAAAAASAEANILEAAVVNEEEAPRWKDLTGMPPLNPAQRTCEYVQKHSASHPSENSLEEGFFHTFPERNTKPDEHPATYEVSGLANLKQESDESFRSLPNRQTYKDSSQKQYSGPPQIHPQTASSAQTSAIPDMVKFLIRREMVTSGLQKFDDCPQNYWGWKASFTSLTKDLTLSPREELDLLVKWLGPQSSEQAKRISSVNVQHPATGLYMVWKRLEETYGAPEAIEHALFKRIEEFPRLSNKDNLKLQELGDLLLEMEYSKEEGYLPGLAYLDTARGINPIVEKLPYGLQEKWITLGSRYKETHHVPFPPFKVFSQFVRDQARTRNDPSFAFSSCNPTNRTKTERYGNRTQVSVRKTGVEGESTKNKVNSQGPNDSEKQCPIHKRPHPLSKCRTFRNKPLEERKAYLKENRYCFNCCASTKHMAKDCQVTRKCKECDSERHVSALHPGPAPEQPPPSEERHGGEEKTDESSDPEKDERAAVTSMCTEICGGTNSAKSCAKICLAKVYPAEHPEKAARMYVVMDDQSNRSLARSDFFDLFDLRCNAVNYTLKTCSGVMETSGRRACNFVVESLDGSIKVPLPTLLECDLIPDDRTEIPSPEVARHYSHLKAVADKIPPLDPRAQILLLLGRDVLRLHKVRAQRNGPHNAPYAQRLDLGWVVIGDVCLGRTHKTATVTAYKTNLLSNGRSSFLEPCSNSIQVKESLSGPTLHSTNHRQHCDISLVQEEDLDTLGSTVFNRTKDDDRPALSVEDQVFLDIMDKETARDSLNSWTAPLPFQTPRRRLPNNREQALKRLYTLRRTLDKKPDMKEHFTGFMQKMFDNRHAEPAPPLLPEEERWYLPIFGVYHPQKPGQIRVVFDSSAKHEGVSLNDVLLSGPDLNNTLVGVLIRFRKEPIAVTADIQQMFYSFIVREDHRDYLRFLWYEDNDLQKDITEYRMNVHVFGNSPSPAVAIYGLRRAAQAGEEKHGTDARQFISRCFYVDDGLTSLPTEEEAVSLLKRTKEMLAESNIHLHKIASNSHTVMESFAPEDLAKDLKNLDLGGDPLPVQRSLGLSWNLESDSFLFKTSWEERPFTKRGVLSTVNSLYDPLGFVAPITVQGKALMRELTSEHCEWDDPLPADKEQYWRAWRESLKDLEQLSIPRPYVPASLCSTQRREICVFSDASTIAIAAVAYLRVVDSAGQCHLGFVMGKAKLAPRPAHTIPRLELCAAVLAVEMAELIAQELDLDIQSVTFYTDSTIVLGYINNTSRRFYVYVANRVNRIRKSTQPEQWHHVTTDHNPADHATRPIPAGLLGETSWFRGPAFLKQTETREMEGKAVKNFDLVEPETDAEIRPQVTVLSTKIEGEHLGSQRFECFSVWRSMIRGISRLIHLARLYSESPNAEDAQSQAKVVVIKCVQREIFGEEICKLGKGQNVSKKSPLWKLNPTIDREGLLRVGGRISSADLPEDEKHPYILPKKHHVSTLLVRHYHEAVAHQGRHLTEGALRSAGLWIIGGRKLVSSVIHECITCRKLRGKTEEQLMADLPADRLTTEPPFTRVGLDVFGPWNITTRRTRGGSADSKRWAVLFTCLGTRAVHIEIIESMSTSSFINALRRFFAIRGPSKLLRSDRGTNFVGACKELKIKTDDSEIKNYLQDEGCTWTFNAPHSSHMGGCWERLIGVARRILDGMLMQAGPTRLTHEILTTLMAEVMAIMNARPLVPLSADPESPTVLTPAMLLTRKMDPTSAPHGDFDFSDLYRRQWKHVQCLADTFWKRWRQEYLATLQPRRKWTDERRNIEVGDVVLLKESQSKRNEWPTGLITKTIASRDDKVRKVEVKIVKQGTAKIYLRPVSELVLLLPKST